MPEATQVREMFGRIAKRYDAANTVLSFGIHHRWRSALVRWSGAIPGDSVLDCATGTGDLAFAFARRVVPGKVIGTDFCAEMLAVAKTKGKAPVRFEEADVMNLSYADATFDVTSIAFGVRNVVDPRRALAELRRVTKPGGRVMVLEFGDTQIPVWRHVFGAFSRVVLPRVGGWVTGDRSAYEYLQETSSRFPCGAAFVAMMHEAGGFRQVEARSLSGGIAYLYRGVKS